MSWRRPLLLLILSGPIAVHALLSTTFAVDEDECDKKTVKQAYHCRGDDLILAKKDLVSKRAHYVCASCKEITKSPGKCETCGKKREKRVSEKGVCPKCYEKPTVIELCIKTGYACPKCGETGARPAKCEDCSARYKKLEVPARIHYRCPACKGTADGPGKCKTEGCERHGKARLKACSQSGKPPHVATKKRQ